MISVSTLPFFIAVFIIVALFLGLIFVLYHYSRLNAIPSSWIKIVTNGVDEFVTMSDKRNMNAHRTHAELCSLWRLTDLAKDMGVSVPCAANWKARDFVPPWYWSRFIEMAEARHDVLVTYRQLAMMTEYRRLPVNQALRTKEAAT